MSRKEVAVFVAMVGLAALVIWVVGCAIGTRQEFWLRPTADIHGNTNIVNP